MRECKHLKSTVSGGNRIGFGSCPDCKREVNLSEIFDNWLARFREIEHAYHKGRA